VPIIIPKKAATIEYSKVKRAPLAMYNAQWYFDNASIISI
jgi:hypothetical protein